MSTWAQVEEVRNQLKEVDDALARIDSGLLDYVGSVDCVSGCRNIVVPTHIKAPIVAMLRYHYEEKRQMQEARYIRLCHEFGVAESEVKP